MSGLSFHQSPRRWWRRSAFHWRWECPDCPAYFEAPEVRTVCALARSHGALRHPCPRPDDDACTDDTPCQTCPKEPQA